jgi:hypothetical protein
MVKTVNVWQSAIMIAWLGTARRDRSARVARASQLNQKNHA